MIRVRKFKPFTGAKKWRWYAGCPNGACPYTVAMSMRYGDTKKEAVETFREWVEMQRRMREARP